MNKQLICWSCGESLSGLSLPLSRRDQCKSCQADLHVCLLCELYNPNLSKQCREPIVEEVHDKEHANFCDYFSPKPNAYNMKQLTEAEKAKTELNALFGVNESPPPFSTPNLEPVETSEAELAREQLENLFKK